MAEEPSDKDSPIVIDVKRYIAEHELDIVRDVKRSVRDISIRGDLSIFDGARLGEPIQYYEMPITVDAQKSLTSQMKGMELFLLPVEGHGGSIVDVQIHDLRHEGWGLGMGGGFTREIESKREAIKGMLGGEPEQWRAFNYLGPVFILAYRDGKLAALHLRCCRKESVLLNAEQLRITLEELREENQNRRPGYGDGRRTG